MTTTGKQAGEGGAAAQAPAAEAGFVLRRDLPCLACGYDLRGLPPQGRCPECGLDVSVTVATSASPAGDAPLVDLAWRRHVRDGAWLCLAAFGVTLYAAGALVFTGYRPGATSSTLWFLPLRSALQWYGTIKLGRPSRAAPRGAAGAALVWMLYALATAILLLPVVQFVLAALGGTLPAGGVATFAKWGIPAATFLFFLQLGVVFRRLGAGASAGQAWLLAVLVPLATYRTRIASDFRYGGGVLMLAALPSFQHGSHSPLADLYYSAVHEWGNVPPSALQAVIPLWGMYLLARLLFLLWRVRARAGRTRDRRRDGHRERQREWRVG